MAKILALAFLRLELSGGALSVLPATPPILGSGCHGALSTPFAPAPLAPGPPWQGRSLQAAPSSDRMPAPQPQEPNSEPASSPGERAAWSHSEPSDTLPSAARLGVTGQLGTRGKGGQYNGGGSRPGDSKGAPAKGSRSESQGAFTRG